MSDNTSQERCYHCGGILTFASDSYTCLMCGREIGHKCDLCMNIEPAKPVKKKRGRKKVGVAR